MSWVRANDTTAGERVKSGERMDGVQLCISIVSGGLAGASVSTFANRIFYARALRTRFHPIVNNLWGSYINRLHKPDGRYLVNTVGYLHPPEDRPFVESRSEFFDKLIEFSELKEARELRRSLFANLNPNRLPQGQVLTTDLMVDYKAIDSCLMTVQKKLNL
jgi:hypothetical protein